MSSDILTEEEIVALMQNLAESRTGGTASRDEMETLLTWAKRARIGSVALEMVLAGEVKVDVIGDEVEIGRPWTVN